MEYQWSTIYNTQEQILCTSTELSNMELIIHNAGALHLPLRSISIIPVQAPTKLNTQHIYQLNTSDDLPSTLIPLAADHRIHHKHPKLLSISILNTAYDTVHIPGTTMTGTLYLIEIEDIEVSNIFGPKQKIQTQQIVQQDT